MGDSGDLWREVNAERAEKRAANRRISAEMLVANGFGYESKNGGAHLWVEGKVNFWPGTGLWSVPGTTIKNRGVRKLIKYLNGASNERHQSR